MSEQQPSPNEQPMNPGIPNLEMILNDYRADMLAAIEQHAPLPYEEADMEGDEYDADRMRGYNEGRDEVLEVVRKILGTA